MEEKGKGCVYFFRHIGLTPVKIGFSTSESPIDRFNQFKTYAPYGSEIIGFIRTYEAKDLETILHERFSQFRLSGEWFEIKQEDCESIISFYSNIEDIKEKNEFQIEWAKKIQLKKSFENTTGLDEETTYPLFLIEKCFLVENSILKLNERIRNKDFYDLFTKTTGEVHHIKHLKKLIKLYCKSKNYEYSDGVANSFRYFIIRGNGK